MRVPETCRRCGSALDGHDTPSGALLADLCLGCLDAVWDAVMGELQRRRADRRPAATGETNAI